MSPTAGLLWLFVALVFLLGLALVYSRWKPGAKLLLVVAVAALYVLADGVLQQVWGRPSNEPLPERFVLLAAVIDEPAKNRSGALYVWVNALENGKPSTTPRAYALPYSKDLHSLLNDGMRKSRQGVTQLGSAQPKRGTKGLSWLRPGSDEQQITIKDFPAPQLPEK